jgi:V/A-type H+-transporting ATPase subunit E
MAEEIRDLIEKINQDGIKAAEEKAKAIEDEARQKAEEILSFARKKADEMIASAEDRVHREDEKERILLAQAGRDLLLSLRKEINAMLGRIIVSDIRESLTPDALFSLLVEVVRNHRAGEPGGIMVILKKEDLEALEKSYLNRLEDETKTGILLRPSEEIAGGFTISFDSGRSYYDFSDRALAEYIGTYLKPKLNQILKDAVKD